MKKLLLYWIFLIISQVAIALSMHDSILSTQNKLLQAESSHIESIKNHINLSYVTPSLHKYTILLTPIIFTDDQIIATTQLESSAKMIITNKLITLPDSLYKINESNSIIVFKDAESSILKWQKNNTRGIAETLQNAKITESVNILENTIHKNIDNQQIILFGVLKNIAFAKNEDSIPYTSLTSIMYNLSIQVKFYLVSAINGTLIHKFIAIGHSGISKLVLNNSINISYDPNLLITPAFDNLNNNIYSELIWNNSPIQKTKNYTRTKQNSNHLTNDSTYMQ